MKSLRLVAFLATALCLSGCCLFGTAEDTRPLSADGVRLNRIQGASSVDIPAPNKMALTA